MATTPVKLYETAEALLIVEQWIDEHADELLASGGELPPALAELIDQATAQLEGKVEKVALKVRELEATAGAVKLEADRLAQRAKTFTNAAAALKAYLKVQLERTNVMKVEGKLATVALQKNSQPSVSLTVPLDHLPKEWVRQPPPPAPELDKEKVLKAFKAGEDLPAGVTAAVGTHLRIR
jgi:hypothetical protein